MSIELHCKSCDTLLEEHDGLAETCRKLLEAEKAKQELAVTLRQVVSLALEVEKMHAEEWPHRPSCKCDYGPDDKDPRRGPKCAFCAVMDRFREIIEPWRPNA